MKQEAKKQEISDNLGSSWVEGHFHLSHANSLKEYVQALEATARELPRIAYVSKRFTPQEGYAPITIAEVQSQLNEHNIKGVFSISLDEFIADPTLLNREEVVGIRLNGMKAKVITTEQIAMAKEAFQAKNKHFELVGNIENIKDFAQEHRDINLVIDHFAWPQKNAEIEDFGNSLQSLVRDFGNKILFKGPGARTSITPEDLLPFVKKIEEKFGLESILVSATDFPHIGQETIVSTASTLEFVDSLIYDIVKDKPEVTKGKFEQGLKGDHLEQFLGRSHSIGSETITSWEL